MLKAFCPCLLLVSSVVWGQEPANKWWPDALYTEYSTEPVFLSEDKLSAELVEIGDEIRLPGYGEIWETTLQAFLRVGENQASDCRLVDTVAIDSTWLSGSRGIEETLRSSAHILEVEVSGTTGGFFAWTPGTLVEAVVLGVERGDEAGSRVQFFMPVGPVVVSGRRVCARNRNWIAPPQLGERLWLAVGGGPVHSDLPLLKLVDGSSVLRIESDGRVALPASTLEKSLRAHYRVSDLSAMVNRDNRTADG